MDSDWTEFDVSTAFFPVELQPAFMMSGPGSSAYVRLPNHRVVMDTSRKHPLAVVSKDYQLITNEQAFKMGRALMPRVFSVIRHQDMACLNVTMPATRSFCVIDLIDRIASFEPWRGERWTAFLRITNSYNRMRRLSFEIGFCRWICMNGMIFGAKSVTLSYTHSREKKDPTAEVARQLGKVRNMEYVLTKRLLNLRECPVPKAAMLAIACLAFGFKASESIMKNPRRAENLVLVRDHVQSLADEYFESAQGSAYDALNVLTDFASRPVGVISAASSTQALQRKAGRWVDEFPGRAAAHDFDIEDYADSAAETVAIMKAL
jgi:hypothetical protein